jgi:hypothetical protein
MTLVPLFMHPAFFGNTWFDQKSNYSLNVQIYSGLENHCNVWQFWTGCDLALDSMGIALSIGGMG